MNDTLKDLDLIDDRMRRGDPEGRRLRRQLTEGLVPLIRCAIRSGTGLPPLVRWVRAHLPETPSGVSPESAAPSLADLLCDTLLCQPPGPQVAAAGDTVPGW
jgi:hypothetical protein